MSATTPDPNPMQVIPCQAVKKLSGCREEKVEAHDQGGIAGKGPEGGPVDRIKFLGSSREEHTYALAVNTGM